MDRTKLVLSFAGEDYLGRRNLLSFKCIAMYGPLLNILFEISSDSTLSFILSQCYERLELIQNKPLTRRRLVLGTKRKLHDERLEGHSGS